MVAVRIGTSGWQYRDWRGTWYPEKLPQLAELSHLAERLDAVELNGVFYRLPERSTTQRWANEVPDDFRFAPKASRYFTHIKRLRDPAEPIGRMLDRLEPLGKKLGPILLQLPPNLRPDLGVLDDALGAFPDDVALAIEPRHTDWFHDAVYERLARRDVALCIADRRNRRSPEVVTASWGTCASTRAAPARDLATATARWRVGPSAFAGSGPRTRTSGCSSTTTPAPAPPAMPSSCAVYCAAADRRRARARRRRSHGS